MGDAQRLRRARAAGAERPSNVAQRLRSAVDHSGYDGCPFVSVLDVRDVDLAITAANAGAELIRSRVGTGLRRTDKGGGDFATDVDIEALCAAAGCVVTDLRGGPIHAGDGGLLAAADQATHQALLSIATRQRGG